MHRQKLCAPPRALIFPWDGPLDIDVMRMSENAYNHRRHLHGKRYLYGMSAEVSTSLGHSRACDSFTYFWLTAFHDDCGFTSYTPIINVLLD